MFRLIQMNRLFGFRFHSWLWDVFPVLFGEFILLGRTLRAVDLRFEWRLVELVEFFPGGRGLDVRSCQILFWRLFGGLCLAFAVFGFHRVQRRFRPFRFLMVRFLVAGRLKLPPALQGGAGRDVAPLQVT